ncbi:MAG: N-acetyltransferase [Bifidobacteriaceae bacterium]|jgi:predicted GNAT family acetyltransferase|nr:N-acetyltransferase [Bifidobacteriaceae bacterium]
MADSPKLSVRDDAAAARYELLADDAVVAIAEYQLAPGVVRFVHTEVPEELSGRGLGQVLVRAALDDARAKNLAVEPYCSFVRHYIETHPDYQDLVPADRRAAFGLPGAH